MSRWCTFALGSMLLACSPSLDEQPVLDVGSLTPSVLRGDKPTVAWVLRTEDCITCRTPAIHLRAVQRHHGGDVRILVVGVDGDPLYFESFLRQERIDAKVVYLDERTYRRAFANAGLPALYVIRNDSVVEAISGKDKAENMGAMLRRVFGVL